MTSLVRFRSEIDIPRSVAYLNTAATGPTPRSVRRAMQRYEEDRARRAEDGWDGWLDGMESVRRDTARFFRAGPEEVAFLSNTGHGLNTVAHMLRWRRGDEVVTTDLEFPSNVLPWRRLAEKGVRVRVARSDGDVLAPAKVVQQMTRRTRLVTMSWVSYRNGQRLPVREIAEEAHRRDAYVLVDAIQGAGALQPDFRRDRVDFLACGGHKWLMAPFGSATLIVRRDLLAQSNPAYQGWFALSDRDDFALENRDLHGSGRRFEIGNPNFGGIAGWGASMRNFEALSGFERVVLERAARLMALCEARGLRVVTPRERDEHAGIVCVEAPKAREAVRFLARRRVSAALRGSWVRLSAHFWNSDADLERAVDALSDWVRRSNRLPKR